MSYETAFTITHKNDARIRIIENETNIGLTQSLNKAIKTANGIYMARMDADDIMAKPAWNVNYPK